MLTLPPHFPTHMYSYIYLVFFVISFLACTPKEQTTEDVEGNTTSIDSAYQQPYRLSYHFSPKVNWMNDPNGLVYYEGEYHLFFQYNPKGTKWGNMHWGHAVSKDLVYWEELPIAIEMDQDGTMIYSGSAVVDHNTSGLCEGDSCIVAIYTADLSPLENQDIAVSNDQGRTFQKFEGNPVLDQEMKDFRDPKVFWYEEAEKWVMAIALPIERKIQFYSSENLKEWDFLSDFGPVGDTTGIWECPDLFPLSVANTGETKWVLLVSFNEEEGDGSDMQYFVGNFDGQTFTNDNPSDLILAVDDGPDYYAAVTWNNAPDDQRLSIGWFSNWKYGADIPTSTWRSSQSIVRELSLNEFPEGIRLVQRPTANMEKLRYAHQHFDNIILGEQSNGNDAIVSGSALEIVAEFAYEADSDTGLSEVTEFGILIFKGDGQETTIGYDVASQLLFVDRKNSGEVSFHEAFPGRAVTLMPTENNRVKMHLFIDKSSVEVFGNNGYKTISSRIFPEETKDQIELYAIGGEVTLLSLDVWKLKSIWEKPSM